MKKLFTILTAVLLTASVFAQSPEKMSYQAVIRDGSDVLVTNTQIGMEINIHQGSASGTVVYTETQTPTTNANGLVSIEIGGGAGFNTIDWSAGPYFIETKTDPTGGTTYTITGTSQLLSVPYALHAKTAETVTGNITETDPVFSAWDKDYNDLINTPAIPTVPTNVSAFTNDAGYLTSYTESDPIFTAWDKSTGISITESQISDLGNYLEAESQNLDNVLTQGNSANNKNITNLADPVNAQDAATKAYVDELKIMILDLQAEKGVTDARDGKHYNAVRIGNQIWMAENLAYLPSVNQVADGSEDAAGSYYYVYGYNGTDVTAAKATSNYATYGVLYNWTAAMAGEVSSSANPSGVQGVCPTGWHLPSDAEWTELTDYLGGESVAGGKLKETGTTHWTSPNTGAINETGFTALPGGYRYNNGAFSSISNYGLWWSATESNATNAWSRTMYYSNSNVDRSNGNKELGFSVRCVRD